MKTRTKWILGIVIGLVVLAVIAAIVFLAVGSWGRPGLAINPRSPMPMYGRGDQQWRQMPMQPFGGMRRDRNGGFFPFGMIAASLLCLGVLALIVLGVIALVRSLRRPAQPALVPAQAVAPALVTTPEATCPNCSRPVQANWSHCPYCGTNLTPPEPDVSPSPL